MTRPESSQAGQTGVAAWLLGAAAVVATVVTHWPVLHANAVFLDDYSYLADNPLIGRPGLESAARILGEVTRPSSIQGYYQPLSMLSLMVDYALGGRFDRLGPFHRTNLLLHAAAVALLVTIVYRLFPNAWAAALAGLLFGVHPITVESVAWVAERKTLLAAFFGLASLRFYLAYLPRKSRRAYAASLAAYVFAVLSKPTLTLLPVLLLLLDVWPLRRFRRRAVVEKWPFFLVGAASVAITILSQAGTAPTEMPAAARLGPILLTVCHNVVFYLRKIVWPAGLAAYYPSPSPLALTEPAVLAGVVGSVLLTAALAVSLRWTRAAAVGFLFFLVALSPTLGVIRFTHSIAADRFAYFPLTGLLLVVAAVVSRACDPAHRAQATRIAVIAAALLVGTAAALASRAGLRHWADAETLVRHIVAVEPRASVPRSMLGNLLVASGRLDEGIEQLTIGLAYDPGDANLHNSLGKALEAKGDLEGAMRHYREAIRLRPIPAEWRVNLGNALLKQRRLDEAMTEFQQAAERRADAADAFVGMGKVLWLQGRPEEAIAKFERALRSDPQSVPALTNLGRLYAAMGRMNDARRSLERALAIDPSDEAARAAWKALEVPDAKAK